MSTDARLGPVRTLTGACQCGAIRYTVTGLPKAAFVCHCRDCQRQSASAFGMALWVDRAQLQVESALQEWTRNTPSGTQMVCRFCPVCGCRLFHQIVGSPFLSIKTGSLDDPSDFAPTAHIWVRSKQAWVDIPSHVQSFEGNPPDMSELAQAWERMHLLTDPQDPER
jgi:hypothetical protein